MVKYIQNIKANVVLRKRVTLPLWGGWVGLLLFLLSSCVKDEIYNTDHPDKARVTISTSWNDIGSGIEKPAAYTVEAGTIKEEAKADKYTLNMLLDPGNQTFYLYNNVTQIPVTDGVAKVNTVTVPRSDEGVFIEPLPGWLFTGTLQHGLEKDSEYQLTAGMHQQVRQLTLVIEPEGGSMDRIASIQGYLSGIAGELSIMNGEHRTASNVELDFTKITSGTDAGKWSVTVRLLGITGGVQKLTGLISFTGGSPEDITLESDLSQDLSGFNSDKKTPLTLGGEIIEIPTPAGFTATIVDWVKVNSGTGVAQ